jgi:uncharacterized protein YcnI
MRRHSLTAALIALAVLPTSAAQAHVTLQPKEVPAGGFTRLNVRVPNERDKAATTKVVVQFPEGFNSVGYEPVAGWKISSKMVKLAQPITVEGEKVTERVDTVTLSADKGEGIEPGQFRDFGLSLRMPDKPATITFKAIQTYDNGEVVRWIGSPDADQPAPQVKLTAAPAGGGSAVGTPSPAASGAKEKDDDDGNGLAIAALIAGLLGLTVGAAALLSVKQGSD